MGLTFEDKEYIAEAVRTGCREVVEDIGSIVFNFMNYVDARMLSLEDHKIICERRTRQLDKILERYDRRWQKVGKAAQT